MLEWFGEVLSDLLKQGLILVGEAISWLWGIVAPLIAEALAAIPGLAWDVSQVMTYLNLANAWIPLSETFALFGLYLIFWASLVVIGKILKAIPTVW